MKFIFTEAIQLQIHFSSHSSNHPLHLSILLFASKPITIASYITITINWLFRNTLVELDLVAQLQQVIGSSPEGERKAYGHSCIATSALCTGNHDLYVLYSYIPCESCLSSPRAKGAGPKGLRADGAPTVGRGKTF